MRRSALLSTLAVLTALTAAGACFAEGDCAPLPGGRPPFIDCPPPQMAGDIVMVPMRAIFEFMGCAVQFWPETGAIEARQGSHVVDLWLGNTSARVNGRVMTMQLAPRQIDGATYIPLRFVATAMGAGVDWSEDTKTVAVRYARRKGTLKLGQRGISAIYCG
jgi:hypothetical protein